MTKRMISAIKKEEKKIETENLQCIVCGEKATHAVRGSKRDTYCQKCAKECYKYLNYLDKL